MSKCNADVTGLGAAISAETWASVQRPTAEATGLPNLAYVDSAFAVHERDALLGGTWTCIGFGNDLSPGAAARPLELLGLPLVMVRDRHGEIRVFHNVCRHRGQVLVREACALEGTLRCPYHSWAYRLDGSLRGTPHIGGAGVHELEGFDKRNYGLREVRSATWLDMVFVNLSGDAPGFAEHVAPVLQRWAPLWGEGGPELLRTVPDDGELVLDVAANWKLPVENYCESYHLPWVHPGLNSYSRIEDHYNIDAERFAGQGTRVYDFAARAGIELPQFPAWPADKRKHAEYIALFPNILLGLQVDHFYAILLEPLAHDRTRERVQLYYVGDEATSDVYAHARHTVLEGWREVFVEDVWAVEGMQRGRHSPAFDGGVFSPVMDVPTHCFHKWAAARMARARR